MLDLPPCAYDIARTYEVPAEVIQAVRQGEGGKTGKQQCTLNKDGTCDNGEMQINDGWFDGRFSVNLTTDYGITRDAVIHNQCQNIAVGTWLLRYNYDATGGNWNEAFAAYNVGLKNRKGTVGQAYAARIVKIWHRLKNKTSSATAKPAQIVVAPKAAPLARVPAAPAASSTPAACCIGEVTRDDQPKGLRVKWQVPAGDTPGANNLYHEPLPGQR